jgi:hypothetical protein
MNLWKHAALIVAGAGCIVAGVFFPPALPYLSAAGAKLLLVGGGTAAVSCAESLPRLVRAFTGK